MVGSGPAAGGFTQAVKPLFYFNVIFIEIVGEREYPFYGSVVFLAIILREERWLWKRKEF
jgi:hypothetical protein